MVRCEGCGAEGLVWKEREASPSGWKLFEPDGYYHWCKPKDIVKETARKAKEQEAQKEAVQKHREDNGYL